MRIPFRRLVVLGSAAMLVLHARDARAQAIMDGRPHRVRPPGGLLQKAADLIELRWESTAPLTPARFTDPETHAPLALSDTVVLDMAGIDSAWAWRQPRETADRWEVLVRLSREGAARFGATTATHVGRRLAVLVDGHVTELPVVESAMGPRVALASGRPRAEADSLVDRVNAMAVALRPYLPVRLH